MWIPYDIRGSLKAETDTDSIRRSRADSELRDFLVGFHVRNPVTQAWELDIVASADGDEIVIRSADGAPMVLRFCANEAGKVGEVLVQLRAGSAEAALARAHDALQRRLLRYVVETGRGMAIAGWRIADTRHQARWRCTPFRPSALQLEHDTLTEIPADLQPLVELLQRARNAADAATRFLSAYSILAAAARGHPALARAQGATLRATQEMLVHAGAMALAPQLNGCSLAELMTAFKPQHDRLVTPEGLLAAAADDLQSQQSLARLANLADLIAHRLLKQELEGRQPATPDGLARFIRLRERAARAPAPAGSRA